MFFCYVLHSYFCLDTISVTVRYTASMAISVWATVLFFWGDGLMKLPAFYFCYIFIRVSFHFQALLRRYGYSNTQLLAKHYTVRA